MEQNTNKVGWLTHLESGKRIVAVMLLAVAALSGVIIHLSIKSDKLYDQKEKQIIECEQRAGSAYRLVNIAIEAERKRSDSALSRCEMEKQDLLLRRIKSIENSSDELDKILQK